MRTETFDVVRANKVLIETLWNVNFFLNLRKIAGIVVLIETLWNVNVRS